MCLVLCRAVALRQEEAADYLQETDRLVLPQLEGRVEQRDKSSTDNKHKPCPQFLHTFEYVKGQYGSTGAYNCTNWDVAFTYLSIAT